MKNKHIVLVITAILSFPLFVQGQVAKPLTEVIEFIVEKCPPCKRLLGSPAGEKLVARGIIKESNAEQVAKFLSQHGDDGMRYLDEFGDAAITVFNKYGDQGISYLKRYGHDYLNLIKRESPETVNKILAHPKGMVLLRENKDLAKLYTKHGDDLLDCLGKNALCIETMDRTGLSPKALIKLSDANSTWLDVKMPQLDQQDANTFRQLLEKYGDPAADFVRKNQNLFLKAGVFALFAANFDTVINGGREVLINLTNKTIDKGGDVVKEPIIRGGEKVIETLGTTGVLLLVWGVLAIYLLYRFLIKRRVPTSTAKQHDQDHNKSE